MPTITPEVSESTILDRVIAPESAPLSPELAKELLRWGFDRNDQELMSTLAAKARAGTLTDNERIELEGFERVSSFLGMVKSKARKSLSHAARTSQ